MAKGNPNDSTMKLNFVAKVWDEKANDGEGDYRPLYIAPDATDTVRGDVYLSDAVNSMDDAAMGVTAATPKAIKQVNDNANTKVSKVETANQTMEGSLSPLITNTLSLGTEDLQWADMYATTFHGALDGNAATATALQTPRDIAIKNGNATVASASFSGLSNITINLTNLDASTLSVGTVPIERLPQGALERVVSVQNQAARFALTKDKVQLGDTVRQIDTGVMYVVIDENKLNSEAGYLEYHAGTSVQADKLTTARTLITDLSSTTAASFNGQSNVVLGVQGQLPTARLADSAVTLPKLGSDVGTVYVGSTQPTDTHVKIWIVP